MPSLVPETPLATSMLRWLKVTYLLGATFSAGGLKAPRDVGSMLHIL